MRSFVEQIASFDASLLGQFGHLMPWELTTGSVRIVEQIKNQLDAEYLTSDGVTVHRTATIETGASIKGMVIVGPRCFVAAGALVRDGCWLDADCVVGPGSELKSSFVFARSKLAHFNYVGDSILGSDVNMEAGSINANHRNEWEKASVSFIYRGKLIETGASKFGALVGDGTKIGANAVVAPGAILTSGTVVERLSLVDQSPGKLV